MDIPAVHALLGALIGDARIAEPLLALADAAITHPDAERSCLIASSGSELGGAAIYGTITGAEGAARVHLLAGGDVASDALLREILRVLGAQGARVVVAELPRIPGTAGLIAQLRARGFEECGRVADYYAAATDLIILRRDIDPG